jgi:hypothetical protein
MYCSKSRASDTIATGFLPDVKESFFIGGG